MSAVVWQVVVAVCAATGAAVILVLLVWALATGGRTVSSWYRFERAYRQAQREERALAAAAIQPAAQLDAMDQAVHRGGATWHLQSAPAERDRRIHHTTRHAWK